RLFVDVDGTPDVRRARREAVKRRITIELESAAKAERCRRRRRPQADPSVQREQTDQESDRDREPRALLVCAVHPSALDRPDCNDGATADPLRLNSPFTTRGAKAALR